MDNDEEADDDTHQIKSNSDALPPNDYYLFVIIAISTGLFICCVLWILVILIRRRNRNIKYNSELQIDHDDNDEDKVIETVEISEDIDHDNKRINTVFDEEIAINQ